MRSGLGSASIVITDAGMKPRLRSLGLRVAALFAVTAALFGVSTAAPVAPRPISLLGSFDEAFARAREAVEQRIAALEQPPADRARSPTVASLLARFERQVGATSGAAHEAFTGALAIDLSANQRAAVLSLIGAQLSEARGALACTTDPEVHAEYELTCAWLREIRSLITRHVAV
jgi:hypothetical protein